MFQARQIEAQSRQQSLTHLSPLQGTGCPSGTDTRLSAVKTIVNEPPGRS